MPGSEIKVARRDAGGDEGIQEPPTWNGYAAKFNSRSLPLGLLGFREQIDPHAFDETLAAAPDVRFTFNHDPNKVFGRTKSGTLKLAVDDTGLRFECNPPENHTAKGLTESIERGDISQCSFAFRVLDDDWSEDSDGDLLRTLKKVSLHDGDVAAVTYPAYPNTEIDCRALEAIEAIGEEGRARMAKQAGGPWRAAAARRNAELAALES